MTLKEFRDLSKDSERYKLAEVEFSEVQEVVTDTLEEVFKAYKTQNIPVGEMVGSGPLYQFCNEIVREFIRKL